MMAAERDPARQGPHQQEEDGDTFNAEEQRRPRRRFRGSHWRHASQTYTPSPPPATATVTRSPPRIRPQSLSQGLPVLDFSVGASPVSAGSAVNVNPEAPASPGPYSTLSKSFASELSKAFAIDEDPRVEELESSLREKNHRLSMQTSELEILSQRIREAEERLRRVEEEKRLLRLVEEENEDASSGRPTPPISPVAVRPLYEVSNSQQGREAELHESKDDKIGDLIDEYGKDDAE